MVSFYHPVLLLDLFTSFGLVSIIWLGLCLEFCLSSGPPIQKYHCSSCVVVCYLGFVSKDFNFEVCFNILGLRSQVFNCEASLLTSFLVFVSLALRSQGLFWGFVPLFLSRLCSSCFVSLGLRSQGFILRLCPQCFTEALSSCLCTWASLPRFILWLRSSILVRPCAPHFSYTCLLFWAG